MVIVQRFVVRAVQFSATETLREGRCVEIVRIDPATFTTTAPQCMEFRVRIG
jgi:hypothetical protein